MSSKPVVTTITHNFGGMRENTKPNNPNPKQAPDMTNSSMSSAGGAGGVMGVLAPPTPRKLPNFLARKPF